MKTIGSVLKRLLLALGGSAPDNYYNDITLVDKIADLAENGQIPSSVIQGMVDLLTVYPVGSIYMSVNNTSPATLFGGTWEQLEDRFLLGAGTTYTAGSTGGEETHQLTVDEMPSHTHAIYGGNQADPPDWFGGSANAYGIMNKTGSAYSYLEHVGGGQAHNNMPPYLAVYMWKRTA